MSDWISSLWSTDGFVARKDCGAWTPELISLHSLSDVLIWLAYLSIPLVLLAVARHRAVRPLRPMLWLFAAFIVSCGMVHLIEAVIFEYPVYRLSGVLKGLTAVVSWATVFALVPTLRKVLPLLDALPATPPADPDVSTDPERERHPALVYALAVLVGLLAVLVRYAVDPLLGSLPAHGLSLLAVIFIGWYGGFAPGLVTLLVSGTLNVYLFVPERNSLVVDGLNHQVDVGVYLVTGLGVLVLGELQRRTRRRLYAKMTQLREATAALAGEKAATDRALAQLDALVRNAPYSIAFLDSDLRPVRVNEVFAQANRIAVEDHYGRRLPDLFPDIPSDLLTSYQEVLTGGPPVIGRLVAGGGRVWEVSAFRVPLDDDRGGLGVIGQDVTDRQAAADQLRASEEKFRAMADGIPQLAWMARPDGHLFWYNRRWYEYTGTTFEEMEGWGWEKVHDPVELKRMSVTWRAALASGRPWEDTFPLRRHDGEMRWHLTRATPLKDDAGHVLLWFGTNTDITAQRQMEDQLRESEGRFRQLAEAMPQIVWVARADGYREYYNTRWTEYTGVSEADTLGHDEWADALHPDDRQRGLDAWARSVATGERYDIEYRFRRTDGAYEWFLGRAVAIRDEAGQVVRWLGTCTGIDEQVKAAQALVEKEAYIRGILDSSPDCIKVIDLEGRVLEFNKPGLVALEIDDCSSLLGCPWADLWPSESRELIGQAVTTAVSGRVSRFSGWSPTAKGVPKYWDVLVAPIPDASGRVVRLVGVSRDVTDQKRTEDALRDARRFSESVLHSLPGHLAVIEADGHILSVNESWRQFGVANGMPPDYDWTTANYFEASRHDDHGERAAAGIRAVARGERGAFEMEYPCIGGGREQHFMLRANRFRGDGPVRLVVTHENITERVVAERQVREASSQLAQLTEGVPLLMWACAPTGECDYLSRQWLDYTGRGLVEQLGFGWLDVLHPEDREHTTAAWQKAVGDGGGYEVEFRIRRHDGVYRWFAVRGIPLREQSGTIVRWFGSCTDVDDRVQQEQLLGRLVEERTLALKEQKIFLNAILDNVAEGIVACDAEGKLQLFNAATRRIHGLPSEPLPSERWADRYQLFEADGVTPMPTERVPLLRAWRGEEVHEAELVVRAVGQPERFLQCFGQQLRGDDGRVFGAVVSMRDVTVRREYERELVRTADALRASNQELEKFAYIASHDLQEPLRKIQAFGTRLSDKFRQAVGDQGKDYIDRMLDSAGRMRRLIEDLLAFSRVTSKAVAFAAVDLNAVARDVLSDLEERVARSGGRVEVGRLPTVPGDPSQLRQVFQNLIGNALKFAKPDTPPLVRVSAVSFDQLPDDASPPPAGDGWRITVVDNGIGFAPQYADRIFELFQRLHGRGEYEGTGLGLAIVRKIVVRHGAAITAHSRPGSGAEFVLDWPARPATESIPRGD